MTNTFTAPFGQTPMNETVVVTAAGTYVDDAPTNSQLLVTADATNGCLVTKITCMPRATVTVMALNLFFSPDGTEKRLVDAALMAAHTVATTTIIPVTNFSQISETTPMRLQAGEQLWVNASVALAGGLVFYAEWTDF
jgi:hypothetical protein